MPIPFFYDEMVPIATVPTTCCINVIRPGRKTCSNCRDLYDNLQVPITIQSPDNNLSVVANKRSGFMADLWFLKPAKYAIRLGRRADSTILLTIVPLRGAGSPESFPVRGADVRSAALRACDTAVERLTVNLDSLLASLST